MQTFLKFACSLAFPCGMHLQLLPCRVNNSFMHLHGFDYHVERREEIDHASVSFVPITSKQANYLFNS